MSNSLHLDFELQGGEVNFELGAAKRDLTMIYVGAGCDGALQLRGGHPQDETDIQNIDGAVWTMPGIYALGNILKGTSLKISYAGITPCKVTIR